MNDGNAKQQIVERIKNANNILVSVSTNPTVDDLCAALGLTMMLNRMDKHATAVFSGVVPPAISFLNPEKTFEGTVDSLRDFIIELDKEKADRLRYKVEDDVVRIFITPYRTTITQDDLQFTQGDFNVDLIIALGVEQKGTLDQAIVAHGRILHDATVVTINANSQQSSLGSLDWHDANASSLCEMLMALSEALQPGLIDEPTATALLTGIVAATERFANRHTTPKVMTMSAQLMAAGANQQLIATKLEEGNALPPAHTDGPHDLSEDSSASLKSAAKTEESAVVPAKKANDGEMVVEHDRPAPSVNLPEPEQPETAVDAAEDALADALAANGTPPAQPTISDLGSALAEEAAKVSQEPEQPEHPAQHDVQNPGLEPAPKADTRPSWMGKRLEPPTMGGTLNATSEEALEDKLKAEEDDRHRMILSHDSPKGDDQAPQPPAFNSFDIDYEESPLPDITAPAVPQEETEQPEQPTEATQADPPQEPPVFPDPAPYAAPEPPQQSGAPAKTLAELEAEAHAKAAAQLAQPADNAADHLDQARQEVSDALSDNPYAAPAQQEAPTVMPEATQPSPVPPMPPLPDFSTLPPLPEEQPLPPPATPIDEGVPQEPQAQPPILPNTPSDNPSDPAQFRIPGQ